MAGGDRRIAATLLCVIAFLIVFGTLYPFSFSASPDRPIEMTHLLTFAGTTPSDVAANVLLYLPFGACLAWLAAPRRGNVLAVIAATAAGAALSLSIEIAQLYETRRVASLPDFASNTAGAFAGAMLSLAIAESGRGQRASALAVLLRHPVAAALMLSWIGFRLAPFVPALEPGKWATALAPLGEGGWLQAGELPAHCLAWLIIVVICRRLAPVHTLPLAAAAMAVVLVGRVVLAGLALETAEISGMAVALAASATFSKVDLPRLALALAGALAVLMVFEGLAPFDFQLAQDRFALVPFGESLGQYRAANLPDTFLRCFMNGALVWLLVQAGLSALPAAGLGAGIVFSIELLQTWLPGETAEITDPILAVAAGGLIALFEPGRGKWSRPAI